MKKIFVLFFLITTICGVSLAQKKKNKKKNEPEVARVSAKIEVLMEGNYSKSEIEQKAIQAARIKAIGDIFGYAIVQGISTQTVTTSGDEVMTTSRIQEMSNTVVKGEWVADEEGFPTTRYTLRDKGDNQEIWLICEVKGLAREIAEAKIDLETFAYNCPDPENCKDGMFKHHDSMYLYFRTPLKGYLSVYMLEDGLVYRLLPYAQMGEEYASTVPVEADKEYFLFDPSYRKYFEGFSMVDEYGLETYEDGETLANFVYVVFSTEPYKKPILSEQGGIKYLEANDFQLWLNKNRALTPEFHVKQFNITIRQ